MLDRNARQKSVISFIIPGVYIFFFFLQLYGIGRRPETNIYLHWLNVVFMEFGPCIKIVRYKTVKLIQAKSQSH